jgi:hypothetical protein
MTGERLQFELRSGGTISIDLSKCASCESKACLAVCSVQGGPLVLDESRGVPGLRFSLVEIQRGGCVECLGCELDCSLHGNDAVRIDLPLERLDEYLDSLTEAVVYPR